jgi:myosin heavy subunit
MYRNAKEKLRNYVMVLNGDSGSGKSEISKYAIDYFTKLSCKNEKLRNKIMQVCCRYGYID